MNFKTIHEIISHHASITPNKNAIYGLGQEPTTYNQLFRQIVKVSNFLNKFGIHRNDPVAIVLPNGPLMATSFLAIASFASSAPLNPSYTSSEFDFYLNDLMAKLVVVEQGSTSPIIQVASKLNIPVIYLHTETPQHAGLFGFSISKTNLSQQTPHFAQKNDIALILHTSGTTSRPKMVPLTQKNLCTSAQNIANTLRLTSTDHCLNIMPLFHIHGLMAAVLAPIIAGASIVCTPGFYAPKFFNWLDEYKPTYYTAVPTIHQAILHRAKSNESIINQHNLRFVRSSSSSLAPSVMSDIEKIYKVPVIEAYGMTEASHQIASNPLPPGKRKPGSVGKPAGPEVAIMHEDYPEFLHEMEIGEIVIRGENVTLGYLNNEEANRKSFPKGWFRTGDQGYLDEEGYLYITGRIKEIINRGGEKISPREVDEALLLHPMVQQAVTFSIPDQRLGEDIGAAVILHDARLSEKDLKLFLSERLALHKIPRIILFLDEIPKGATGKIQRIGLAKKLGIVSGSDDKTPLFDIITQPETLTESKIFNIWKNVLQKEKFGINQRFREVGGDSMLATLVHQELEAVFGLELSLVEIYSAATIKEQANLIEKKSKTYDN